MSTSREQSLLAAIQILTEKNEILTSLNTETTTKYKALMIRYNDLETRHKIKEEQLCDEYEQKLNNFMLHINEMKKILTNLEINKQSLLRRISEQQTKQQLLEHKCNKKQRDIKELKHEKYKLENENMDLQNKLNDQYRENNNKNIVIDELQDEIRRLEYIRTASYGSPRKRNSKSIPNRPKTLHIKNISPHDVNVSISNMYAVPLSDRSASIDVFITNRFTDSFGDIQKQDATTMVSPSLKKSKHVHFDINVPISPHRRSSPLVPVCILYVYIYTICNIFELICMYYCRVTQI